MSGRPGYVNPELTAHELRVVKLVVEGLENSEIAASLGCRSETVKTHMRMIRRKWDVHNRTQVAVKAVRLGIG